MTIPHLQDADHFSSGRGEEYGHGSTDVDQRTRRTDAITECLRHLREGGNVEYAIWSGLYRIYDTYLYNIYNLLVYNKYKGITSKLDTLYSSVVYVKTVELHMALQAVVYS